MATRTPTSIAEETERLIRFIRRAEQRKYRVAVNALWRVGDAVRRLRSHVTRGAWRHTLAFCAARVGLTASALDEAVRAAEAFDTAERRALRRRFAAGPHALMPSHVIELARAPAELRARGVELLLEKPLTVRELRARLREPIL
jgi:hypothetical protein